MLKRLRGALLWVEAKKLWLSHDLEGAINTLLTKKELGLDSWRTELLMAVCLHHNSSYSESLGFLGAAKKLLDERKIQNKITEVDYSYVCAYILHYLNGNYIKLNIRNLVTKNKFVERIDLSKVSKLLKYTFPLDIHPDWVELDAF